MKEFIQLVAAIVVGSYTIGYCLYVFSNLISRL